jgi:hypothetical protein
MNPMHIKEHLVWSCFAQRVLLAALAVIGAAAGATETVVLMRHAEKPVAGLGQLSCQGLRRSLALPGVLAARFDGPTAIFAPDPAVLKDDRGVGYSYVRPLATIEPTAIAASLPIDTRFGFTEARALEQALLAPALAGSTVFVAWEHHVAERVARELLAQRGDPGAAATVPIWDDDDFDALYVVTIGDDGHATFRTERENLDGLATTCP